jgi:hypothetical protein
MFSEQALDEAKDLDGRIDYLFEFIRGDIVSWESRVSGATNGSSNHGHKRRRSQSWYSVKTDVEEYLFYLVEYTEDTDHPENVGLYMLQVIEMKNKKTQFHGINRKIHAGIYIPDTGEAEDETVSPT